MNIFLLKERLDEEMRGVVDSNERDFLEDEPIDLNDDEHWVSFQTARHTRQGVLKEEEEVEGISLEFDQA